MEEYFAIKYVDSGSNEELWKGVRGWGFYEDCHTWSSVEEANKMVACLSKHDILRGLTVVQLSKEDMEKRYRGTPDPDMIREYEETCRRYREILKTWKPKLADDVFPEKSEE